MVSFLIFKKEPKLTRVDKYLKSQNISTNFEEIDNQEILTFYSGGLDYILSLAENKLVMLVVNVQNQTQFAHFEAGFKTAPSSQDVFAKFSIWLGEVRDKVALIQHLERLYQS